MFFALVSLAQAGDLSRIQNGWWLSSMVPGPNGTIVRDTNLWVDIAATNVGYGKAVGIRWTDDGWATWHDADAWYEGGYGWQEQWGVDLNPIGTWTLGSPTLYEQWDGDVVQASSVTIEYALWMSWGGWTWWDDNNGHNYSLTMLSPS